MPETEPEIAKALTAFRRACRRFEADPTDNDTSVRLHWAKQALTAAAIKARADSTDTTTT